MCNLLKKFRIIISMIKTNSRLNRTKSNHRNSRLSNRIRRSKSLSFLYRTNI